jgi:hypothetical protein
MVETISKRLHISGLTPSLKSSDIHSRFSAFGTVKDISGFGAIDANGDPKKFAYLTLDATEEKLRRCLSSLSGTVWKGAKLRVGDAKPDFAERYISLSEILIILLTPTEDCKRRMRKLKS